MDLRKLRQAKHHEYYRDLHKGETVVVVCNGPSVADVPVQWLNAHITIGMNSFYRIHSELAVDYWCLEGMGHLRDPEERNERMKYMDRAGLVLVNRRAVHHFEHFKNVRSIDYMDDRGKKKYDFSFEPLVQHGSANSVTYFALQLAYYLGGNPTLIIGLDHRWVDGRWHGFTEEQPGHVGPSGPMKHYQEVAGLSYGLCAEVFAENGRTLLNLTPDTALDTVPTGELEEWLD